MAQDDKMGRNKTPNADFQTAFNQVCEDNNLNSNDPYLKRKAHDALDNDAYPEHKDELTFQQLKQRIEDAIV